MENKEPKYKIGDLVLLKIKSNAYKGEIKQILNYSASYNGYLYAVHFRVNPTQVIIQEKALIRYSELAEQLYNVK